MEKEKREVFPNSPFNNAPITPDYDKNTLESVRGPDITLFDEWKQVYESKSIHSISPERQLIIAVLEDGLRTYIFNSNGDFHYQEACRWLYGYDSPPYPSWPFTFKNICTYLTLDANRLQMKAKNAHTLYKKDNIQCKERKIRSSNYIQPNRVRLHGKPLKVRSVPEGVSEGT